jgi:hypothetical protein
VSHKFTLTQTAHSYLAANKLYYRSSLMSLKTVKMVLIISLFYLILGLGITYLNNQGLTPFWILKSLGVAVGVSIAVVFVCYFIGYLFLPYRTQKLFEQQKLHHLEQNFDVTDDALIVSSELFNARLPYSHAYKWAEDKGTFLLFHSDITFQFFPKDEVPANAIATIKANLMASNCPGREF